MEHDAVNPDAESLIRFSHFLKINLGSVISPIETATNSHPLAPNPFSTVCTFWRRQLYGVSDPFVFSSACL